MYKVENKFCAFDCVSQCEWRIINTWMTQRFQLGYHFIFSDCFTHNNYYASYMMTILSGMKNNVHYKKLSGLRLFMVVCSVTLYYWRLSLIKQRFLLYYIRNSSVTKVCPSMSFRACHFALPIHPYIALSRKWKFIWLNIVKQEHSSSFSSLGFPFTSSAYMGLFYELISSSSFNSISCFVSKCTNFYSNSKLFDTSTTV